MDSGRLMMIQSQREVKGQGKTYSVKTCIRNGRSLLGGKGKNGVNAVSIRWNSDGIPGSIHNFLSNRTTGYHGVQVRLVFESAIR